MKKCVMFGAAGNGERLYSKVCQRYEVIAYTDNNQQKWGGVLQLQRNCASRRSKKIAV